MIQTDVSSLIWAKEIMKKERVDKYLQQLRYLFYFNLIYCVQKLRPKGYKLTNSPHESKNEMK